MQAEQTLASDRIYDGRVVGLRVDEVRLPNGHSASREVVDHKPSVVVVPVDEDGNVVLVRQYRYPIGADLLEAPAGGLEEDETPSECALRELQEEIGYTAGSLESLGRFWTSPGFCNELMYAFVARGLVPSKLDPDPDENIQIEAVPLSSVGDLIRRAEIQDAKTIAALLMATCLAGVTG